MAGCTAHRLPCPRVLASVCASMHGMHEQREPHIHTKEHMHNQQHMRAHAHTHTRTCTHAQGHAQTYTYIPMRTHVSRAHTLTHTAATS